MVQNILWQLCILSLPCLSGFVQGTSEMENAAFPIFARDSETCGAPELVQCDGDPNLPSNFCCPQNTTCYSLDNSSSMLCCPGGADCTVIEPIVCDLELQNATANPTALGKTTKLDDELPLCGKGCCPHGYACTDEDVCEIYIEDAQILSTSTSSASATVTPALSTSATAPAGTATSPVSIPGLNQRASNCPQFPGAAVAVGFFPGLAVGVILSIAWFFWSKRHANRSLASASPRSMSPGGGGHMRQRSDGDGTVAISDPIPTAAQDSMRTDFLRHQPDPKDISDSSHSATTNNNSNRNDNTQSRMSRTGARVRSLFTTSKPVNRGNPPMPTTPPRQVYARGEMSTESLHNHDPTNLGSQVQHTMLHPDQVSRSSRPPTTFTDMMERVGFQNERGSPFYPVMASPESQTKEEGDVSRLRGGQNG